MSMGSSRPTGSCRRSGRSGMSTGRNWTDHCSPGGERSVAPRIQSSDHLPSSGGEHHRESTATRPDLRQHRRSHPRAGPCRGTGSGRPPSRRTGARPPSAGQPHLIAGGSDGIADRGHWWRSGTATASTCFAHRQRRSRRSPGSRAWEPGAARSERGAQHARGTRRAADVFLLYQDKRPRCAEPQPRVAFEHCRFRGLHHAQSQEAELAE